MKKNMPLLYLGTYLSCLGLWPACAQDGAPLQKATQSANTSPSPANPPAHLTSPRPDSVTTKKSNAAHPTEITTLDGTTYKGVTVQKIDPDGLTIAYAPATGGIGAAKIKFKNLSEDLQRQFNYNPENAATYETQQAKGLVALNAQRQREEKAAKLAVAQQAREDALEQQRKEELERQRQAAPKPMTEQEKKQAQKEIEATWSKFKTAVKAGRITN